MMFIIPTKALKSATPDAPKPPRETGSMSKSELEALAARVGWTPREISYEEIMAMSSAEAHYHEICNKENYDRALSIHANKREYKETKPQIEARRMWHSATEEETAAAYNAGDEFANRYPGFVRHSENAKKIAAYMESHDLDATKIESYAEAFTDLAMQGLITLSPRDAGIGPEARLTDPEEIKSYPKLHLLLQPKRVLKPEDKLSADEYRKLNPDLFGDNRVPPMIQARIARKQATEEFLKRSESVTDRSGSITNLTDYKRPPIV